jgi:hypothetical protein
MTVWGSSRCAWHEVTVVVVPACKFVIGYFRIFHLNCIFLRVSSENFIYGISYQEMFLFFLVMHWVLTLDCCFYLGWGYLFDCVHAQWWMECHTLSITVHGSVWSDYALVLLNPRKCWEDPELVWMWGFKGHYLPLLRNETCTPYKFQYSRKWNLIFHKILQEFQCQT